MHRSNPPNRQILHTKTRRLKEHETKDEGHTEYMSVETKEWNVRLKDAKPKANSRGLLSPWKQEGMYRNGVCEDAERQRVRGLETTSPHNHSSSRRLIYKPTNTVILNLFQDL